MNNFIWTDLSTYKLKESVVFYSALLGWTFTNDRGYYVGGDSGRYNVGIYETPEFFQKINMPHFWMNYIGVENLRETTSKALELGGKVELSDIPFYEGNIALIRDPMGAGFTVYEGTALFGDSNNKDSSLIRRELHTSNAKANISFYQELFDWNFLLESEGLYRISTQSGDEVGRLLEIDNETKGKYEYWVTEFEVDNLDIVMKQLARLRGSVITNEGNRILITDKFGEAFVYLSSK